MVGCGHDCWLFLPGRIPLGRRHRRAPGRGQQRQQRLLAAGAPARYALGIPPERVAPFQYVADDAFPILLAAHRAARDAIKRERADLSVGWTLALADIQAGPGGEERAARVRRHVNEEYLEAAREDDFFGVQTYSRSRFGPEGVLAPPEGAELNQMGEEFYPQALEATIRQAAQITGRPIIVTENGLATTDDTAESPTWRKPCAPWPAACATASTYAATATGRPWTTSSGTSDTARRSG